VETTDCLEAVGVFRAWKNVFFVILLISLVLTQAAFWTLSLGIVKPPAASTARNPGSPVVDPNGTVAAGSDEGFLSMIPGFTADRFVRGIGAINGILVVSAALFCSAMYFSLMVSLVGRLGGIRHIARAFILSLILLALILPWQKLLNSQIVGVVWSPGELVEWLQSKDESFLNVIIYYLRFTGYWLVALVLLFLTHSRTGRWSSAIVRRLEII